MEELMSDHSEDVTSSQMYETILMCLNYEDPTSSPPDSFDMPPPLASRPISSVDSDRLSADELETSSLKADLDLDLDLGEEPLECNFVSIEDRQALRDLEEQQALRHRLPRSREEANERYESNRTSSRLLQLPQKISDMIYSVAYGGFKIDASKGHQPGQERYTDESHDDYEDLSEDNTEPFRWPVCTLGELEIPPVCRDFTEAARKALFMTASFRFKQPQAFESFVGNHTAMLPCIRQLEIEGYWSSFASSGPEHWRDTFTSGKLGPFKKLEALTLTIEPDDEFRRTIIRLPAPTVLDPLVHSYRPLVALN